ncbi:MAG: hypothetical protein O7C63_01005, partial [Alphaproteobacteria bacterium]|nr:hypothetical protein [Alphaproteobacteria bacterium]
MSDLAEAPIYRRGRSTLRRVSLWAAQTGLGRRLVLILFGLSVVVGVVSFLILSEYIWDNVSPELTWWILVFDLVLVLTLSAVIIRAVVRLWAQRRMGAAGSQLHVRLVTLFVALTVAPTIIVAALAAGFFNAEMRSWFNDNVQSAVDNSLHVAEAYLNEHYRVIEGDAMRLKNDLENRWRRRGFDRRMLDYDMQLLQAELAEAVYTRRFHATIIFDSRGQVLARRGITSTNIIFQSIRRNVLEAANTGRVAIFNVPGDRIKRVRALVRLRTIPVTYLYVDRLVDDSVLAYMERT